MDQVNNERIVLLQKSKAMIYAVLKRQPLTASSTNEADHIKTKPSARPQTTSAQLITDHKLLKLYKAIDMAG